MALFPTQSSHHVLRVAYAVGVRALNHRINRTAPGPQREPRDPEVETLLQGTGPDLPRWEQLYEAEQRLVMLMTDADLTADHARRMTQAEGLALPGAKVLDDAFIAAGTTEARIAAHLTLVDELQFRYQKRTLDREVRREKANTLNWIGIVMVFVTVFGLVLAYLTGKIELIADYHLLVVLWFGAIGAFLSRIIAFQGALNTLDYDSLIRDYSGWSIALRLIVGTFGALVGYFLIRGQLVGGELFPGDGSQGFFEHMKSIRPAPAMGELLLPDPSAAAAGVEGTRSVSTLQNAVPVRSSHSVIAFSSDFAKVLVWSTVAGFSERLIPDRLAAVETAGQSAGRANG